MTSAAALEPRGVARVFTARRYVVVVRPAFLGLVVALMAINDALDPDSVTGSTWRLLACFTVVQAVVLLLVLRLDRLREALTLTFLGDAVLTSFGVLSAPEPIGASALMTLFVVAASFYTTARVTLVVAAFFAAEITVTSHLDSGWDNSLVFPNTAFVVLATGILGASLVARMRRGERALQQAIDDEVEARAELERVGDVRDRLIANVSHELRTPLTATLGSIETLMREDIALPPTEEARLLGLARDGGTRLLSLVEDLLTLGVTPPESVVANRPVVEVAPVVEAVVEHLGDASGRTLTLELDRSVEARIEPGRLAQVADHLVTNALHHGAGDVLVEVAAGPDDSTVVLRVSDHGAGVPPAHVDELFLPFSRFSSRSDSTGLGLAICRSIAESCGGTVAHERSDGVTRFEVRLPRASEGART